MKKPQPIHWTVAKRILRCLAGTQDLGIVLRRLEKFTITVYHDVDWASDTICRRSYMGILLLIGALRSRPQSLQESEFRAITATAAGMDW